MPIGRILVSAVSPGHRRSGGSTIDTAYKLAAVIALILANAFFVAVEFSLVAIDRGRVDREAAEGGVLARTVSGILRNLSFHLSGAQLGITATSLVLGFVAEPTIAVLLEPITGGLGRGARVVLALVIATVFQMVVGELVPKAIAVSRADATARRLAPLVVVYGVVAGPLVRVLNGAANWSVRKMGIEPREELATSRTLEELQLVVRASAEEGAIDPEAEALLRRSIRFGEKTAADALVPRVSITAVDVDATVTELVALSVATGFSRFPVHRGDIDDIAGVVHVKRVYDLPFDRRSETSVSEIMDEPYAVPETIDLETLLLALRDRMAHLAIVVDEHGGTAGIITVEDLVEEIVGEIDDEHDPRTPQLTVIEGAGEYLLSGALHTDEVREACGFEMPEGDYETLAGFILDRLGHIPEVNEEVTYDGWCLRVLELDRLRISTVRLVPPAEPAEVGES